MALELGQKWSKYGQKCHKNGLKMIQIWYKQGLKYLKSGLKCGLKCDPKPCSFETLPKIAKGRMKFQDIKSNIINNSQP